MCPYTPRCPQSDKDTVSRGQMWDMLNLGPQLQAGLAAQHTMELLLISGDPTAVPGTQQPQSAKPAATSWVRGHHPRKTRVDAESSLRSPCCSQMASSPLHEDSDPGTPRCHLGKDKGQERMALRAGTGLKGLLQTGGDS